MHDEDIFDDEDLDEKDRELFSIISKFKSLTPYKNLATAIRKFNGLSIYEKRLSIVAMAACPDNPFAEVLDRIKELYPNQFSEELFNIKSSYDENQSDKFHFELSVEEIRRLIGGAEYDR